MGIALLNPSYAALVCVNNLADDAKRPIRRPSGIVVRDEPSGAEPDHALGFIGIRRVHQIAIEGQEVSGELLAESVAQA